MNKLLLSITLLFLTTIQIDAQTFNLHSNGVTIVCEDASVGDTGDVNGVEYTKRTRDQITPDNASTTCTSGITNMANLFFTQEFIDYGFNEDISHWDVSNVTDMVGMFHDADVFNGDLSAWDVSKVTNMHQMFRHSRSFNGEIGNWDVSNVDDMSEMFFDAQSFNQPIGDWNTGSVTTLARMFNGAVLFNQDISGWNTSKVTTTYRMFFNAHSFNQPLNSWDVSSVIDMATMFAEAHAFNQPLNSWNTSSVQRTGSMFWGARSFNQDLNNWDMSADTNMTTMFVYAEAFNGDVSTWNTSNVKEMAWMFGGATSFDGDISSWDVSNVIEFQGMFWRSNFNQDISNWNTSSAKYLSSMFAYNTAFNQPIGSWDVSKVEFVNLMFDSAIVFNQPLNDWNINSQNVSQTVGMFRDAHAFNHTLEQWDMSGVNSMHHMFDGAKSFNQDINNWDVSNVTDMSWLFHRAESFNSPLDNWDVSNVHSMRDMFSYMNFNQDISGWHVPNLVDAGWMFATNASFNQDLSNWCVGAINEEPNDFNFTGSIAPEFLPRWGECKELDETGNLVLNANFEQRNVYQDWDLWLADWEVGNVNFYEENGQLILDNISSAGSQSWSIQINQYISASQNARLEVGGIYRLRFEAVSDAQRPLKVWIGLNEEPFTPVLEHLFTIDGELDFYEVEFTMEEKFENMKLGFEFGTSDVPAALDNISLEKIGQVENDRNIVTYDHSNPTELDSLRIYFDATKGAAQLRDDNNDSFEDVYIYTGAITNLSSSDTDWRYVQSNWEDMPDRLKMTKTNQNLYEFAFKPNIREFFGIQDENERILKIAMVFQGLSYDENGNQVIVKGSDYNDGDIFLDLSVPEQNLIVNGNFALGDSDWILEMYTTGNIEVVNEELAFTGLDASGNSWDAQAHQYFNPSLLEVGANYRVSFDARTAEGTHDIHVFLGEVGGNWNRYFQPEPGDGIIRIDEEMKTYHLYTSVNQVWESMRLGFEVNYEPGDVFIDNVSLVKVDQIPSSDYIASVYIDTMLHYSPEVTVTIYADDILPEDMIESYNLILPYDEGLSYLGVATAGTHSENGILSVNDTGTDLNIGFAANGYLSGSMPLIHLAFNAETARDYHFNLQELIFNNIYNQKNEGGLIGVIRKLGDVDNDDQILAYDAAKVLKYSVGLDAMPDEDPMPWDLWRTGTADVNYDGLILASDAADILMHSVGLIDEFSNNKGKGLNPEIIAYVSNKLIQLEALNGGLFGLNIEFDKNQSMTFNEPTTTLNALIASNITENNVKVAIASSEELKGNFLTIPIESVVGDEVLTIDYFINNTPGQLKVDLSGWLTTNESLVNKPKSFELNQNYPNPFNPSTSIEYAVPVDAHITLEVFNALGQKVMELVNGRKSAGYHMETFDASGLSSGVYLYKLTAPSFTQTKKMLLIK